MYTTREEIILSLPDTFTLDDINEKLIAHGHETLSDSYAKKVIQGINRANPTGLISKVRGEDAWRRRRLGGFVVEASENGAYFRHTVHIVRRGEEITATATPQEGDLLAPSWLKFETTEKALAFIGKAREKVSVAIDVHNHNYWENSTNDRK